jgi:putative ABC transport system permease protein
MDFRSYVRGRLPTLTTAREAEILEELAQHLEDVYRSERDAGLDHDDALEKACGTLPAAADELAVALRSASRTPQGRVVDRVRAGLDEPVNESRSGLSWFSDLSRDFRYALRTLLNAPGFTAVVVLTLTLGIGSTSAIFSAVDNVLLKSLPVGEPAGVLEVYTSRAPQADTTPSAGPQFGTTSYPDYVDLRDSRVLDGLAAFSDIRMSLDAQGVTEPVDGLVVTGNYFDVLGIRALLGRTFAPDEDRIGSPARVAVVSHRMWQQRFGAETSVVGRSLVLNGADYTVVGVLPRGFQGIALDAAPDVFVPMALQEEVRPPSAGPLRQRLGTTRLLGFRDVRWLGMVGRVRTATSVAQASAALDVVGRRLAAAHPESNRGLTVTAVALGDGPGFRTRAWSLLALLTAAVTLVLMTACANVASLLLARAVTRRREVAVRVALGAGRGQLIRQWLTESVILGLVGAAGGLVLASWSAPILHGLGIPESLELGVDFRVLTFTLATGVITGLVFGLAPVLQVIRGDEFAALRDESGAVKSGRSAARLRSAFVVLQVALSLVLLVAAGLCIRTLQRAYEVDLGYRVDRVLVADIAPGDKYGPESGSAFYAELMNRLNALPGVVAAGAARVTVLSGANRTTAVSLDGQPVREDRANAMLVRVNVVTDRYLQAMGIPLVRGRGFDASDLPSSPRVAVISRSLAERLWPNVDPVGQMFLSSSPIRVVGVVPDTVYRSATERAPLPFFYLPLSQNYEYGVSLHVRTAGEPLAILPALRQVLRELDKQVAVMRPRRLADEFDRSIAEQRTMAMFGAILSGIALTLAAVGLYGVMAYLVRQRTPEVGLRLALGATPGSILKMMVLRGARLVAIGAAVGFGGAVAVMRFLRAYLFGVEPGDPVTWLAVAAILALVGLAACVIPAWRAMRVDPLISLRSS